MVLGVTLYQSCSYSDWLKNMAARGMPNFSYANIGKTLKICLSETARPRALMLDMAHHLVDLYQVCSNYGPVLGSHVLHKQRVEG